MGAHGRRRAERGNTQTRRSLIGERFRARKKRPSLRDRLALPQAVDHVQALHPCDFSARSWAARLRHRPEPRRAPRRSRSRGRGCLGYMRLKRRLVLRNLAPGPGRARWRDSRADRHLFGGLRGCAELQPRVARLAGSPHAAGDDRRRRCHRSRGASAATTCPERVVGRELLVRGAVEISRHPLGLPRGWPHYRFQSGFERAPHEHTSAVARVGHFTHVALVVRVFFFFFFFFGPVRGQVLPAATKPFSELGATSPPHLARLRSSIAKPSLISWPTTRRSVAYRSRTVRAAWGG